MYRIFNPHAEAAARVLIAHGADMSSNELVAAAARLPTPFLTFLIEQPNVILNPPGHYGGIHSCAEEHQAHFNYYWRRDNVNLERAAYLEENVRVLVAHGADVNHLDANGEPPIYNAERDLDMLKLLIELGNFA